MSKLFSKLITAVLLFVSVGLQAQDAHFSQFYANPLYLNPAMAGTNICPRIATSFRDQWPSIKGEFVSYTLSYDQHFDKLNGGIGILLFGDRAGQGTINTYNANLMYSFKLRVSKKFNMRFALSAGYYQTSLDWNKLTFGDMIDPKYGFVYSTAEVPPGDLARGQFDFAAGMIG
ncbi:MAG TPA: PorP/SprF family type IX secretion system membrane protein, partial [Bacteroidales bacterium]|nr:PorP/SprF family type IX secretion system membrane protein [Bacteroidales bacterium]